MIKAGELASPLPSAAEARARAADGLKRMPEAVRRLEGPEPYRVEHSPALQALFDQACKLPQGAAV